MFGLSLFRPSWQSNPVKNIPTSGEERIEYTASLGEQGQSNALSQGQQRQSNPHPMPCLPPPPASKTLIGALRYDSEIFFHRRVSAFPSTNKSYSYF